jgi:predicted Zn-dependent protease
VKSAARFSVLLIVTAALGGGIYLATRSRSPDRRDLGPLVTVGGDAVRDALRPALDLTRIGPAEEASLGEAIDREIRARMAVGEDTQIEAYLSRLVAAVAANVRRPGVRYSVALVESDQVNAFAVAGGRLYVTTGMFGFVESEAELAAVLGHEISHVDLGHCVERLQFEQAARRVAPELGALARLGYELALLGFSEEQELAADANGAVLAGRASYDPWQAVVLFERLRPKEAGLRRAPTRDPVGEAVAVVPEALRRYLETHPPADQRVEAVHRALTARVELWRGMRLYVGKANLRERKTRREQANDDEWRIRSEPPAR